MVTNLKTLPVFFPISFWITFSLFFAANFSDSWFPATQIVNQEYGISLIGYSLGLSLIRIVFVLIAVAYFTLGERKIMASIQRRRGPNVVGIFGLLQPLADGLKLLCKEMIIPTKASSTIFLLAPLFIIVMSLVGWIVIPFAPAPELILGRNQVSDWFLTNQRELAQVVAGLPESINPSNLTRNFYSPLAEVNVGVLFLLAISSLNVYGIIMAGWASNSKYAFLGSLRSAAQMISYEVSIGLTILPVILLAGTLNLTEIVQSQERTIWYVFPLLPCALIFFVSMLAETNRAPFDLPEAEAELVAGYNVEYSSIIFAMFFLGEYSNMLIMAAIITVLFFWWMTPVFLFPSLNSRTGELCLESSCLLLFVCLGSSYFSSLSIWSVNGYRLKSLLTHHFSLLFFLCFFTLLFSSFAFYYWNGYLRNQEEEWLSGWKHQFAKLAYNLIVS